MTQFPRGDSVAWKTGQMAPVARVALADVVAVGVLSGMESAAREATLGVEVEVAAVWPVVMVLR